MAKPKVSTLFGEDFYRIYNSFIQNSDVCDSIFNTNTAKFGSKKNPFHNLIDTLYYPSKSILRTAQIQKGRLNGNIEYFYRNGKLMKIIPFKNDTIDGNVIEYYSGGKIKGQWKFKNGNIMDTSYVWSELGICREKCVYKSAMDYSKIYYSEMNMKILEKKNAFDGFNNTTVPGVNTIMIEIKFITSKRYFDNEGFEITEGKFKEIWPHFKETLK